MGAGSRPVLQENVHPRYEGGAEEVEDIMMAEVDAAEREDMHGHVCEKVLRDWNTVLQSNIHAEIPHDMAAMILRTRMDSLVSNRFIHLIVGLLTYATKHKQFAAEMDLFITKVGQNTDYRRVYQMVQSLLREDVKYDIAHRRRALTTKMLRLQDR
jgi:hypothetical protein